MNFLLDKKKFYIILLLIIFFIIFMVSFSFPDLFALYFVPSKIFQYNVYSWVPTYTKTCLWVSATYPPLYYFTIGSYINIVSFFNLVNQSFFSSSCPVWQMLVDKSFLFWSKFPFLLLHLASGILFANLFSKKKFYWFLFWVLNPIAIFVNFIEGQFDSFPTFFLLLAFFLAHKRKNYFLISLALGIGGAYKHYPFLLLIPFAIILEKNWLKRILFLSVSILPYIFFASFVYNKDYLVSLQFSQNFTMLQSGISFGNFHLSYYAILYVGVLITLFLDKHKNEYSLYKYSFLFSVLYFITSVWFVQRALFLIPSLLLITINSKNKTLRYILPVIYLEYFIYVLFMYPGLFDHTLLRPLFPAVQTLNYSFISLPEIQNIISPFMEVTLSLFAGIVFFSKQIHEEYPIRINDIITNIVPLVFYLFIIICFGFITNSFTLLKIF